MADETTIKAALFYDCDVLVGRALTQEEYENISLKDLQNAICNSIFVSQIGCEEDNDCRATREFYELSTDQLKQRLKDNGLIIVRPKFSDGDVCFQGRAVRRCLEETAAT